MIKYTLIRMFYLFVFSLFVHNVVIYIYICVRKMLTFVDPLSESVEYTTDNYPRTLTAVAVFWLLVFSLLLIFVNNYCTDITKLTLESFLLAWVV